jgi:phage terminase small subunit
MATKVLTPRQAAFVREYLIDLNATAAYKRAGYKAQGRSAENAASRLLGSVGVRDSIADAQAKRACRTEIKADRVLQEVARLAFSDLGGITDFTGDRHRLKPPKEITEDARRAIASVKVKRHIEGTGQSAREVEVLEFKLWPKNDALDKLMRHLGLLKDGILGGDSNVKLIEFFRPAEEAQHGQPPEHPEANGQAAH